MQTRSRQKSVLWPWVYAINPASTGGQQRHRHQHHRHLATEPLESRLLLSFTPVDSLGGGQAAWVDFNQDGWVDVVAGSTLYKNNNGSLQSFSDGFTEGIWSDYDNDGWPDFFGYNGSLKHNNGGKSFSDESHKLPPMPEPRAIRGAVFGDFNGDSFVDLYVGNYESWPNAYYHDFVMMNNAGQSFDLTWTQGIDAVITGGRPRPARGVTAADFDEDSDLDVYVSNYRLEPNALWQNDGQGNFSDVAVSHGATAGYGHTIGSAIGDFDNDGHLDIFAGNFSHSWAVQPRG